MIMFRISSTTPPRYPATNPTVIPMIPASPPPSTPTRNVEPRPYTNWAKTSCPNEVVPNHHSPDGGMPSGAMSASGSPGRMIGPTMARTRKKTMIVSPMITFLVRTAKYRISPRRLIGRGPGRPRAGSAPGRFGDPGAPRRGRAYERPPPSLGRHAPSPLIETRVRGSTTT